MEPFVFFGGKGGVGKTTVSCAYGYKCASAGLSTLVVSTDPAHSVSDVFDQSFGDEPASVAGVDGLDAMEIDPDDEVPRHLDSIREGLPEQGSAALVTRSTASSRCHMGRRARTRPRCSMPSSE